MTWILLIGVVALGVAAMALACWRIDLAMRWHAADFELPVICTDEGAQ